MFDTTNMYGKLGQTYTSFSKKERTQPVDEQLAALQAQLEQSRAKHQEKLMLLQQLASIGNYVKGNVSKMEAIQRGAKLMGAEDDAKLTFWDKLSGAIFGPDLEKRYVGFEGKKFRAGNLAEASYSPMVADYLKTFTPSAPSILPEGYKPPAPEIGFDPIMDEIK
jgi:hypothetical protein